MQSTSTIGLKGAIATRRTMLGIKRSELAQRAGISYPYFCAIESGQRVPSVRVLRALAAQLGWSLAEMQAIADLPLGSAHQVVSIPAQPQPSAPELDAPTAQDLMAEIRALRRLVEELSAEMRRTQ